MRGRSTAKSHVVQCLVYTGMKEAVSGVLEAHRPEELRPSWHLMNEQEDVTGRESGAEDSRMGGRTGMVADWWPPKQENRKGPCMTRSDVVLRPTCTEEPSAERDVAGLLLQQNVLVSGCWGGRALSNWLLQMASDLNQGSCYGHWENKIKTPCTRIRTGSSWHGSREGPENKQNPDSGWPAQMKGGLSSEYTWNLPMSIQSQSPGRTGWGVRIENLSAFRENLLTGKKAKYPGTCVEKKRKVLDWHLWALTKLVQGKNQQPHTHMCTHAHSPTHVCALTHIHTV